MTPQSGILPDTSLHAYFIHLNIQPHIKLQALKESLCAIVSLTEQQARALPHARPCAVISFGVKACLQLFGDKPEALTHFPMIKESPHPLPDTQTDLLLHVRADIFHVCFTLADTMMQLLKPYCDIVALPQHAFLRHQKRDFTGFIDGTENPDTLERQAATLVADGEWQGGSFVHQQRYLHRLNAWQALATEEQEKVIGRSKMEDIELDEAMKPLSAHIKRVVIEEAGEELAIMRHSLPFGTPGAEHGLMFISYSYHPDIFTKMLTRMFSPIEDGQIDALLTFTTALTGGAYFAPSQEKLAQLGL